ncbi:MAG: phosphoenolpyruvate carboxykinase (ATP), partial [Pseudomonadota bacterium]|nr:phosphoenolpyruvate carboxykinase (ATP) [Pseudomonadota bacterium]
ISIQATRAIIDAILNGEIEKAEMALIPYFNLAIPTNLPRVESEILNPINTYKNESEWDEKAKKLTAMFVDNFKQYTDTNEGQRLSISGPKTN